MNVGIFDRGRNPVPEQSEQAVIETGKIDIERFDIARSGRDRMQVLDDEIGENAALESKFELQIFLGRVMQRDAMHQA